MYASRSTSSGSYLGLVALTGGTGFVGGALLQQLAERGIRVRALVRPHSMGSFHAAPGTEVVRGDLTEGHTLRRFLRGASAVVHCAGAIRGWKAGFIRANVEGTRRLVQAAAEARPTPTFVQISSLAAREASISPYAASKRAAEELLSLQASELPWVILRPPAVYGPGDPVLGPVLRWMARGVTLQVGTRGGRFSLIFVDDLARCAIRLLETLHEGESSDIEKMRSIRHCTFEVDDGHAGGYCWEDVVDAVAEVRGSPPWEVRVPLPVVATAAWLNLVVARALDRTPLLTPGKVRELAHPNWVCDSSPLRRAVLWEPRTSLAEGIRHTLSADA